MDEEKAEITDKYYSMLGKNKVVDIGVVADVRW